MTGDDRCRRDPQKARMGRFLARCGPRLERGWCMSAQARARPAGVAAGSRRLNRRSSIGLLRASFCWVDALWELSSEAEAWTSHAWSRRLRFTVERTLSPGFLGAHVQHEVAGGWRRPGRRTSVAMSALLQARASAAPEPYADGRHVGAFVKELAVALGVLRDSRWRGATPSCAMGRGPCVDDLLGEVHRVGLPGMCEADAGGECRSTT